MNAGCHIQICMNNDVSKGRQSFSRPLTHKWLRLASERPITPQQSGNLVWYLVWLTICPTLIQVFGVNKFILLLPIPLKLPLSWIVNIKYVGYSQFHTGPPPMEVQWEGLHSLSVWAFKSIFTHIPIRPLSIIVKHNLSQDSLLTMSVVLLFFFFFST